jgi:hypothetical protein
MNINENENVVVYTVTRKKKRRVNWKTIRYAENLLSSYLVRGPSVAEDLNRPRRLYSFVRHRYSKRTPGIGLVICDTPHELATYKSIQELGRPRVLAAYLVDSMWTKTIPWEAQFYDLIFVSRLQDVEPFRKKTETRVVHVPIGTDTMLAHSMWDPNAHREIDLLSYGIQPPSFREHQQKALGSPDINIKWGVPRSPDPQENEALIFTNHFKSKFCLYYCPSLARSDTDYNQPRITPRMLSSLACGCTIAGSLPKTQETKDRAGWDGAHVELPLQPHSAFHALSEHLKNYNSELARKHIRHSLLQNDWRYRFSTMLEELGVSTIPKTLTSDLDKIRKLADRLC